MKDSKMPAGIWSVVFSLLDIVREQPRLGKGKLFVRGYSAAYKSFAIPLFDILYPAVFLI